MKPRNFPLVRARPPAIPRRCRHELYPMDPDADGISHVKSGVSQNSRGIYEHRIDIGLEDLGVPARISLAVPRLSRRSQAYADHAQPNLKITKRTQFQDGASTSTATASEVSALSALTKRTPIYPHIPRGWDSLSQPFPPRCVAQATRPFARQTRQRVNRKSHIVNPTKIQ
jgi:hypothetical protein